ncbi:MAG: hypothetical protein ACLS48_08775 [[Eubacterium] siraeum]
MIDFEFEFQYSEESTPTLRKVSGNIPAGDAWCFAAEAAVASPRYCDV